MMKVIYGLILALILVIAPVNAHAVGFKGEAFKKVFHFYGAAGKGSLSGLSAANAKPIADTDLMSIDADTVISKVYVIIDTALTGTTALTVGDDDDADGFVLNSAVTLGTAGMYGWAPLAATYLYASTQPAAKLYSAAGKEVKLDTTTTNTGGAMRIVVEGYRP